MIVVDRPEPDRGHTVAGLRTEYRRFANLIAGLDRAVWTAPTRCTRWEVRDVSAHVVGQLVDTVSGKVGSRTADEQAAGLREGTPAELASLLRAVALPFDTGPGLYASLDFVLGALRRMDAASPEPDVAQLVAPSADCFTDATGLDAHEFLLAATGRLDTARLGLPEAVNIYR